MTKDALEKLIATLGSNWKVYAAIVISFLPALILAGVLEPEPGYDATVIALGFLVVSETLLASDHLDTRQLITLLKQIDWPVGLLDEVLDYTGDHIGAEAPIASSDDASPPLDNAQG